MREFYLENGSGNTYSLTDVKHWLYEPEGLGAKFNSKYEQIDANFIRTKRITKPENIKGKILFTGGNKYQQYSEFIKFIAIEPLTLIYVANGAHRVSVELDSIEKSEIQEGILTCELELKRITRWYKRVDIYNEGDLTGGKVYDYTYDYTYIDTEPETAIIDSDSGYDSPTKISIYGPAVNPFWTQYLNNQVIATGAVTANIIAGHRLVIDCTTIPYSIKEIDIEGNVVHDLYGVSNFETKRFVFLKYGKNRIVVDHDGTNTLKLAVEGRIEYETV